jgi:hypothetical protein
MTEPSAVPDIARRHDGDATPDTRLRELLRDQQGEFGTRS